MKIEKPQRAKTLANKELWGEVQRIFKGKRDIQIPEFEEYSVSVKIPRRKL